MCVVFGVFGVDGGREDNTKSLSVCYENRGRRKERMKEGKKEGGEKKEDWKKESGREKTEGDVG